MSNNLSSTSTELLSTRVAPANILVVDDEAMVLEVMSMILRKEGHRTTTCIDGVAALEHYLVHWEQIDLVVLDMSMPNMGGREAVVALLTVNPAVKIILATGLNIESGENIIEGVSFVLQKPFDMRKFVDTVAVVLGS